MTFGGIISFGFLALLIIASYLSVLVIGLADGKRARSS